MMPPANQSPPQQARVVLPFLLGILGVACGSPPTGKDPVLPPAPPPPPPPTLTVRVTTSGPDPDLGGYLVAVDDGAPVPIGPNGVLALGRTTPGLHRAVLTDVATRCVVHDPASADVTVATTGDFNIHVSVGCEMRFHDGIFYTVDGKLEFLDLAGDAPDSPRRRFYENVCGGNPCANPSVSPDGGALALTGAASAATLLVRSSAGQVYGSIPTYNDDPGPVSWAPDGQYVVAVSRDPVRYIRELFIRRATIGGAGQGIQLTFGSNLAFQPAWSPDGTWIAFSRLVNGEGYDIWMIHPDGTGLRQVTTGDRHDFWPAWSPDGRTLAYVRDQVVHLRNLEDDTERLLTGIGWVERALWAPEGTWLAVLRWVGGCQFAIDRVPAGLGPATTLREFTASCPFEWHEFNSVSSFGWAPPG